MRAAYWAALDGATTPAEAEHDLRILVGQLSSEYPWTVQWTLWE